MNIYTPTNVKADDIKEVKGLYSVFLAGPCPRGLDESDWRDDFFQQLDGRCANINFFTPTNREYDKLGENAYDLQVNWERTALKNCNKILFWVARDDQHPAFTTNVEFGYWLNHSPEKILYGRPEGTPQTRYLDWLYKTHCKEMHYAEPRIFSSLEDMIDDLDVWNNCLEGGK